MRLKGIEISGFGGVSDQISIDLNADVVIIVGANGYGKTTVCNAISWVISGKSPSTQGPRNLYSKSGTTSVELRAEFECGTVTITRSLENPDETDPKKLRWPLYIRTANGILRGADAELWIRRNLVGIDGAEDYDALAESFVDSIYLKQESLREFLSGRQDTERFDAVASMVGAGRLRDFTDSLQSQKRAWVRAIGQSDAALESDRSKLEDLSLSLSMLDAEISKANTPEVEARWRAWLQDVQSLNLPSLSALVELQMTEPAFVDVRRALEQARLSVEQSLSRLISTQAELRIPLPEFPEESEIVELESKLVRIEREKNEAEAEAERLRAVLEQSESIVRNAESEREDLARMASILLRHTSNNCAACGQSVDERDYRARLIGLAAGAPDPALRAQLERQRETAARASARVLDRTRLLGRLTDQKRVLREQRASALAMREYRENRLREVMSEVLLSAVEAFDADDALGLVDMEMRSLSSRRDKIVQIVDLGRQFEASVAVDASRSRRSRIMAEIEVLHDQLAEKEADIDARKKTSEVATDLLDAARKDADSLVSGRLAQLRPLLTQFYAAIDPHPTFRTVEIATRQFGGKHRLTPILRDEDMNVDVSDPGDTLSTSQANALAVSLFLSFNLGLAPTRSRALILDDPLQNLDDVHLLGLVDLLRKILPFRQLLVTTHDHAFAALLARKLRPVSASARTTCVAFTKWDRSGPGIEQWDVPAEAKPLKMATA